MLELKRTPRIVSEGRSVKWLLTQAGHYLKVREEAYRLTAIAFFGNDQLGALSLEAIENKFEVRCIAGLQPGLYRKGDSTFLNPVFVPFVEPPAASDPPEAFQKLADKYRRLKNAEGSEKAGDLHQISKQMKRIFMECRGVEAVGGARQHPWVLLDQPHGSPLFPRDDHIELFEGSSGFIWTSQPYAVSTDDRAEICGFAHQHGLSVTLSPKWSWHYPGSSVLIEWTKAG